MAPGLHQPNPATIVVGGQDRIDNGWTWHPIDAQVETINGQSVSDQLTFSCPPGRFGRSFSITRTLTEVGVPKPAAPRDSLQTLRRYTYKVIFRACRRGGRFPRGC